MVLWIYLYSIITSFRQMIRIQWGSAALYTAQLVPWKAINQSNFALIWSCLIPWLNMVLVAILKSLQCDSKFCWKSRSHYSGAFGDENCGMELVLLELFQPINIISTFVSNLSNQPFKKIKPAVVKNVFKILGMVTYRYWKRPHSYPYTDFRQDTYGLEFFKNYFI